MRQPASVIVCGSNYARTYVKAVALAADRYSLSGVLARGSARSAALAREGGVPLYRSPDDLSSDCDIACAAMSSTASDVVLRLIARGLHVLCEHPQREEVIDRALAAAGAAGGVFHVNGHFGDLAAPAAFITRCLDHRARRPLRFVHVAATDRTLWGALDIVGRALGRLAPFGFRRAGTSPPFDLIAGSCGGIDSIWRIQTSRGRAWPIADGHPDYLVDIRIEAGFADGTLSMASVAGPVAWNTNLGVARPGTPLFVPAASPAPTLKSLEADRVSANLAAIDAIAAHARTGEAPPHQTPEFLRSLAAAWDACAATLAGP